MTDTNSRALTIHYDASNRIDTITDPRSRQWTLAYNASNELITLTLPLTVVGGTAYTKTFAYNTAHDITDYKDALGKHSTFSYNADDSTAWEQDALSNRSTWSYAGAVATKTDPNGYTQAFSYTSGRLSQVQDNSGNTIVPTYDTSNNKTQVQDQRGKLWNFTYDTRGNALTAKDPYTDTTTYTYNSHNKLLTAKLATGEETDYTYDIRDRLTQVDQKDTLGTIRATETYTVTLAGITTDYYDANSHRYQYGHNTNGELTSLTTPLSRVTTWGVNGIGVRTSRQDALLRTTTYTLDGWLRVTKEHYPTGTDTTLTLDANSNLTGWTDSTGTYTRAYDDDNRLLNEKKGTATIVSHTYDATGQKGLLSTTTDANARVLTYSYDGLNRLSSVAETAGTTSYAYDAASHETGITNANGTTVTKVYDDAGNLTSVTNKNSTGTVLSSFSYVYDTDNRRHTVTEASGDVVTYGYDWGSRLTTESRTGTNAYSLSYIVDGVGNRTSQTKGTATTAFTLDSDDQLNSTSSSTGGFVNSYAYNANGEQTGRTLSGTAYTVAFDYDGRQTSITQGANVTSYTYDGLDRRLSRTSGGTTTSFLYDGNEILLEKQGSTTTATYTYGNALVRKDGETPLFDGLGSERTVTNSTQTVTGTLTLSAFGNQVASTGSSSSSYMFAATSGYRNDGDAGLTHVGARYYDAQVGRFTTRDTYLNQRPYLYCDHDPVNTVDPTGHESLWDRIMDWYHDRISPDTPTEPVFDPAFPDPNGPRGGKDKDGNVILDPPSHLNLWKVAGTVLLAFAIVDLCFCCFDGDTPVTMADGSIKNIKDIKEGDWVLSRDLQTGMIKPTRVVRLTCAETDKMMTLSLSGGEWIKTTPNHLFYAPGRGFISALAIEAGTQCTAASGSIGISKVSITMKRQQVYNLVVDGSHTFLIGKAKLVVHDITLLW